MGYIKGPDSRQMRMGLWSIEEEVADNSPARCGQPGRKGAGIQANKTGPDGKTGVLAAGSDQAVSVRLSEWDPIIP